MCDNEKYLYLNMLEGRRNTEENEYIEDIKEAFASFILYQKAEDIKNCIETEDKELLKEKIQEWLQSPVEADCDSCQHVYSGGHGRMSKKRRRKTL